MTKENVDLFIASAGLLAFTAYVSMLAVGNFHWGWSYVESVAIVFALRCLYQNTVR